MSFRLSLFDHPEDLEKAIPSETVFPSREAQNAFLRSSGKSLPGSTLSDLWEKVADMVQAPAALPEVLWREEVRAVSKELPLLAFLREETIDDLLLALRRLDSEALWEIEPRSEIEEAVQILREKLRQRGSWSPEGRRLWIARSAEGLCIKDTVLAPLPSPSRQIGLLLDNLSRHSNITLLLLLSETLLESYLRMLGSNPQIDNQTRGRPVPWGPYGECDIKLQMFSYEEPSLLAAAVSNQGVLLAPSPLADWREIWPAFQESNKDLCFRTSVGARDCEAGTRVADASWEEVPEILEEDFSGQDALWIESFRKEQSLLHTHPSLREFAERVYTPRLWRGEGTRLLSPGEATLAFSDNLVVWGLNQGKYPRETEMPLFFSDDLLQRYPQLRSKDPRPAFVSALLSAFKKIVLLKNEQPPSPFWLEAQRAWGHKEDVYTKELSLRHQTLVQVRLGATNKEIAKRFLQENPEPPSGRVYSVTELESFLRCPLGWWVRYRVAPRKDLSPEAEEGLQLHQELEEAFSGNVWGKDLDPLWKERLEKVVSRYGQEWPAEEMFLEVPLEMTVPWDDGEVVLRGRADRIDVFSDGLLLLDWKRGTPRIEHSLQAALYPLMASARFEKEPLGFLFVHLRTADHQGLLAKEIPGIDVPLGWGAFSRKALQKAKQAIEGIEAGEWKKRGDRCPDWCPHYLLSRTGALGE